MNVLKKLLWAAGLIIFWSTLLWGCQDRSNSNQFGGRIESRNNVAVASVFDNPDDYADKIVVLKGVIDLQDERGYWFYLVDGDYRIYVDLYTANFQIPEMTNKTVLTEGQIEVKMNIPSLLATGVEVQ